MCGLVATYTTRKSRFTQSDANEFFHLLLLNSVRGAHSTGLAGIDLSFADTKPDIVKAVGNPYNLFNYQDYHLFNKRFLSTYTAVIGHGRYATQGDVNAVNAHPFREGNITLAHNGGITNFKALQAKHNLHNIEVDSHLVCYLFNSQGVEKTLLEIDGAFVFMWFNAMEGTFNIVRNTQRPLFMAKVKYHDTLVFASEKETLIWNAERNKTPIDTPVEVATSKWYVYDGLSLEPEVRDVELKKFIPYPITTVPTRTYRGGTAVVNTTSDFKIALRSIVTVNVEDCHEETINGNANFKCVKYEGYLTSHPEFIFKGTLYNTSEDVLYGDTKVKGEISHIEYRLINGVDRYTCTLVRSEVVVEEVDDKFVTLYDAVDSSQHKISKWRLATLVDLGCGWCQRPIKYMDVVENPDRYGFYEDHIICSNCHSSSC